MGQGAVLQAIKRLSGKVIEKLRAEIKEARGNEIFALGYLDDRGLVVRAEVTARGSKGEVLALGACGPEPYKGGPRIFRDVEEDSARREDSPLPDVLIHNHPSGFLTPSDNDLVIASRAAEGGIGAFIIDNAVQEVYVIAEPLRRKARTLLDPDAICASLEEGGSVALRLPSYEPRPAQLDLMRLVVRAFNEDALAAAEAGTGVGKSFAYLLPAAGYALANNERIVISTATITLQQQLYDKDIPLVAAAFAKEKNSASGGEKKLKAALIKGRGNYLCRRRLEDALREPVLDEDENEDLRSIVAWSETTRTGSRSDLSFMPAESLWSRICSEADTCMGMRCPERERCFVLALRKEAADAHILVVNHHLLFADLAARQEGAGYDNTVVLPPYTRIIIDEAHTIEGAATSFFSKSFSRLGVYRQLGRLYRKRRNRQMGLLLRIAAGSSREDLLDDASGAIQQVRGAVDALDGAALEFCGNEGVFRLVPAGKERIAAVLIPCFLGLRKQITALTGIVRRIIEEIDEDDPAVREIKAVLRRLELVSSVCSACVEYQERPGEVVWIERHGNAGPGGRDNWAEINVTPIDVAPSLGEALFKPNKTVICLSATLTVAESFAYWNSRSGLALISDRKILSGMFPSPFPYKRAVLLGVPADAPLPDREDYRAFVNEAAFKLIELAGGSALILFTSYEALKSAYDDAAPKLEEQGIRCFKQGDDDRSRLLAGFLSDNSSALFATNSFWEGIDAPGDTLRLVILCRLPFRIPNDPVFEARCETLEKRGNSPFMDLSLPEAVIKFRQGFGRLMRRSSDRGVVAVLDGRLLHKRYGEYFLRSIPETGTCFSNFQALLRETECFLYHN
ncbi:MAG: ATP-dependent DNA helicase DinG [Treponema sp.]|jgi:ATP-dependent DNA helicase DinG|nr:ATP-dependent DNA helicase DinG [Treponema sp.]